MNTCNKGGMLINLFFDEARGEIGKILCVFRLSGKLHKISYLYLTFCVKHNIIFVCKT